MASESIFTGKMYGDFLGCPGEISGKEVGLCLRKILRGGNFYGEMSGRYLEGLSGVCVQISMYDCKSLRVAVMIWATWLTHRRI